jgi:hypothetical protein
VSVLAGIKHSAQTNVEILQAKVRMLLLSVSNVAGQLCKVSRCAHRLGLHAIIISLSTNPTNAAVSGLIADIQNAFTTTMLVKHALIIFKGIPSNGWSRNFSKTRNRGSIAYGTCVLNLALKLTHTVSELENCVAVV